MCIFILRNVLKVKFTKHPNCARGKLEMDGALSQICVRARYAKGTFQESIY